MLVLSRAARNTLEGFRQSNPGTDEAGGILLGRLMLDSLDVIIDEATCPTLMDERKRFRFRRAKQPSQHRVIQAWDESHATRIYLGEWHSHPEDSPHASNHDRKDWSRILTSAVFEQGSLFFVIVGIRGTCVWEASKETGTIQDLDSMDMVTRFSG